MKKFTKCSLYFLLFVMVILSDLVNLNNSFDNHVYAEASNILYAKARENCFLFKTSDVTNSNYNNVFFIVPESYFVTVLSRVNSFILKVQYKNKIGYVASDSVVEVDFVPSKPMLNGIYFSTLDLVGTQIRMSPSAEDPANSIMIIPAGTQDINYIAYTYGSVPTGGKSNIWYYAEYQPINDPTSVFEGYVYSEKVKDLTEILRNTEGDIVNNPQDYEDKIGNLQSYNQLNSSIKNILIVIICIPVVVIFILLIFGGKTKRENSKEIVRNETKQNDDHVRISRKKSLENLKGKSFKEKTSSNLISEKIRTDQPSPVFPTYEVIDDDDLL